MNLLFIFEKIIHSIELVSLIPFRQCGKSLLFGHRLINDANNRWIQLEIIQIIGIIDKNAKGRRAECQIFIILRRLMKAGKSEVVFQIEFQQRLVSKDTGKDGKANNCEKIVTIEQYLKQTKPLVDAAVIFINSVQLLDKTAIDSPIEMGFWHMVE